MQSTTGGRRGIGRALRLLVVDDLDLQGIRSFQQRGIRSQAYNLGSLSSQLARVATSVSPEGVSVKEL